MSMKRRATGVARPQRRCVSVQSERASALVAGQHPAQGSKLVAGMPVEAFIQTSPRTVMSYLVKPMRDQITKAFKGR
jgi:HlyD family secretion protein